MEFTFNTQIVDISVALNALKLYKSGRHKEAINCLLDILDCEPKNWDARLMLGACYYKTEQYAAAQRAFRFLHDNCNDPETKRKAGDGLRAATAKLQKVSALPAEFGSYEDRMPVDATPGWLDEA